MIRYVCTNSVVDRSFATLDAAERWAKGRVKQLDCHGFSEPMHIYRDDGQDLPTLLGVVRLDGADRAWLDLV